MAERAHPEDPAFQGTIYERKLCERYARCQPWVRKRRVLDAACGTGWGTSFLEDAASLCGVDVDATAIRYGAEHYSGIRFAVGNVAALPFAAGSFDTVVCLEGIEHVFRTEAVSFFAEVYRILSPGGVFVASVPLLKGGQHSGNPWHLFEYTSKDLADCFAPWFDTLDFETVEGPESPEIWFVGTRRAVASLQPADVQAPTILTDEATAGTLQWLHKISATHGLPYTPDGPVTVISTCLGILHLESTGALNSLPAPVRNTWLNAICSAQRADTGLFNDPLTQTFPPGPSHDAEYLSWQTTYFALAALDAAGQSARRRLSYIDAFLTPGAVETWLSELNWGNPWLESNRVMFLLHSFIYAVEREQREEFAPIYHRILDWLDDRQNSTTGLWGTERGASLLNAVAGAYHFLPFYEYVRRPIRCINQIVDSTLALQQHDGLFGPVTGGGACEDLDAIDVLATALRHTKHRQREIRAALVRAWWAVWNLRNANGSFPYAGSDTAETYSFSGWQPLTAGIRTGDIWSTWFRMQALATVASAMPDDVPAIDWQFRRWPALGYRSNAVLTERDAEYLPKWLRRIAAPRAEPAAVTVVITCFNLGAYLHEAIASAAAQTLRSLRIVVVDDGSQDAFTRLLLDQWPYDGVELIRTPNRGVAAARNTAIELATSAFICCLDADDRLRPAFLEKAVALLSDDSGTGFVSCYYELFDCDTGVYAYDNCNLPAMLVRNEAVISSVFRRDAWAGAGGYCAELSGLHDWDLWIGILQLGYRGAVLKEILFDYRSRPGSMYSTTSQPANFSRLVRRIAERHEEVFREYMTDVVSLKARQFVELVLLRGQEITSRARKDAAAEAHTRKLQAAVEGQQRALAAIEEGKQWLEQNATEWQSAAEQQAAFISTLERQLAAANDRAAALTIDRAAALDTAEAHESRVALLESALKTEQAKLRAAVQASEAHLGALETLVAAEQQTSANLQAMLTAEQQTSANLQAMLATEQQTSANLQAVLTAEQQTSAAMKAHAAELAAVIREMVEAPRPGTLHRIARNAALLLSAVATKGGCRNLLLYARVLGDRRKRAIWKQYFDTEFYLSANRDVYRAGISAPLHYAIYGCAEQRKCSSAFDSPLYLQSHPDVQTANLPPLLHYVQFGREEGRFTAHPLNAAQTRTPPARRPVFVRRALNTAVIVASAPFSCRKVRNLLLAGRVLTSGGSRRLWSENFDPHYYFEANRDVMAGGVPATLHYVIYGGSEQRACSPVFDSGFYLRRHPDVAAAGVPALLHYVLFGEAEQRTTAPPLETHHPASCPESPHSGFAPASAPLAARRFRSRREGGHAGAIRPLVSVVIPCFNYGHHLADAVQAVREQTLAAVELIVVEGGSTDGTTPVVVRQLENARIPNTRWLYRAEPRPTGDNRNFGINAARGRYICCLDADDKLNPVYLEVAAFLAETYGYDIVSPSVRAFGTDDFVWALKDPVAATITDYNQVSTVALFRRSAWEEAGGFRDWGRGDEYVAEDWEFWVRLLRSGYRGKCIPLPLHMYRVHNTGIWHGVRSSVDYQRGKIIQANSELLAQAVPTRELRPDPDGWANLLPVRQSAGAILLALPFVSIGGAERIFEAIARSASASGRRVVVITTLVLADTIADASAHFQAITPTFYALPKLFGNDYACWDDFVSYLIDSHGIDLIMIAGCDYMYHALPDLTTAFPHIGVVDQLFNDQVHFATNRHYSTFIDVTMVPSQAFADRIAAEFGEEPDRIAVIPHGVDLPSVPDAASIAEARQRSGIPDDWKHMFLVGFFGRMSPEKAPADFVAVAKALASDGGIAFVMTGDGPEFQQVRSLIAEYGLENRIYTPGFVDDPRDLMVMVDAVLVPSRLDGMPLVVMESQALGKPVVASAVGSIPVMIDDGQTGLLCQPGDIQGFANHIRNLCSSPAMRVRLGRAARQSVEQRHSSARMVQQYEHAFGKARTRRQSRRAHTR